VLCAWYPLDGSADGDTAVVDEEDGDEELDAGAVPQPDGSLEPELDVDDGVELEALSKAAAELPDVPDPDEVEPAARLRNAVTSVLVLTMPTTSQPSADFSVSLVARAAESYEEALTVVNSCGMAWRLVATSSASRNDHPRRATCGAAPPSGHAGGRRCRGQLGITRASTSVPDGGPS
jgi:hypothetical protein